VGLPSYVGDFNRTGTAVGGNSFQLITGRWLGGLTVPFGTFRHIVVKKHKNDASSFSTAKIVATLQTEREALQFARNKMDWDSDYIYAVFSVPATRESWKILQDVAKERLKEDLKNEEFVKEIKPKKILYKVFKKHTYENFTKEVATFDDLEEAELFIDREIHEGLEAFRKYSIPFNWRYFIRKYIEDLTFDYPFAVIRHPIKYHRYEVIKCYDNIQDAEKHAEELQRAEIINYEKYNIYPENFYFTFEF